MSKTALEGQAALDERDQQIVDLTAQCSKWHSEVGSRGDRLRVLRASIGGLSHEIVTLTAENTMLHNEIKALQQQITDERIKSGVCVG